MMWALVGGVAAQPAMLSGFVTGGDNGEAIELANVVLEGANRVQLGATTNRDGLYVIPRVPPGRYALKVTFIGYSTHVDTLVFVYGEVMTRNVELESGEMELDEVLVETERMAGIARVTAGQQTIRPAEIKLIPTPDVAGDLASYLTTLPGVIVTGDRGGQLFIRGGEPTQNLVQLDGILLYQPFHILGFYSAFPSDILSRSDIHAGGFGSKYGERISSVLDVSTREGNKQRFTGGFSGSPFIGTVRFEGPVLKDRISILASGRQSLIEEGAAQYINTPMRFNFSDAFVKLHGIVNPTARASITGLHTYDRGILNEDLGGAPQEEVRWQNDAIGVRYLFLPRIYPVMIDSRLSFSRLKTDLGAPNQAERTSSIENIHAAIDATFFGDKVNVETGISVRVLNLRTFLDGAFQNINLEDDAFEQGAVYAEPEITLSPNLRLRTGVRIQFFDARFNPYLEPRLRLVWSSGVHQVSAAAGIYNQGIIGLNDRRDAASVFTAWTSVPRELESRDDAREGRVQNAKHAIMGYQTSFANGIEFNVEGFYKWLDNLLISEWTAFPRFTTNLQPAEGRAYGFDTRLEIRRGKWYGYINYGYSNTRYTALQASLELWYGTEELSFRPPHDRRHQFNVLVNTEVAGFDLSARWDFGSGLPFSQAVGFDGFAVVDDVEKASDIPGSRRVIYEEPFNATLPTYHRMDFSVNRTFSLKNADVTVQGSLINVYNRRNLFYLDVFTLRRVDQLPFVPSLGINLELR